MKINRFSIALAIMICSLVSACSGGGTPSFAPSPNGSVIASIKIDKVSIPDIYPPVVISYKAHLRIQKIPPSTDLSLTETLITKDQNDFLWEGLTWNPNGRSLAFATSESCRLWIVGISDNFKKTLIAENVYSFRWVDDAHIVYATEDGQVNRATISDDGEIFGLKTLFSVGNLRDTNGIAYHYPGLSDSGGFGFNNPLSPNAQFFVYGNGHILTIVNLSTATIEKSFPLTGIPIKFWWDDGSSNLLIGVQKKKGKYGYTHHYYLYQQERGTLTNLINRLENTSQFSPYNPCNRGRVWSSDGQHFVLNSGYPYYKTWLFNTASLSAVWMEREIKRMKDGNSSERVMVPLPLEDLEYDLSKDPLPELPDVSAPNFSLQEEKRNKMIDANSASEVVIESSPRGNLLAVGPSKAERKNAKSTFTYYVLKIEAGPKGETALDVRKKIESGRKKSFLWIDFWIPESFFWTADGRGLLFVAGDKFRLESIP